MSPRNQAVAAALCLLAAGCASRSEDVAAAYVSPMVYSSWSCAQIREEAARISARAAQAAGAQDRQATNDAVATGVAVVLFWPAAFFIRGDNVNSAELARLKGEMEAIQQVSIQKNCGVTFEAPAQS